MLHCKSNPHYFFDNFGNNQDVELVQTFLVKNKPPQLLPSKNLQYILMYRYNINDKCGYLFGFNEY